MAAKEPVQNVAEYPQDAGDNPCRGRCRKDTRDRKTRLGWDAGSKIIADLAEQLQDCGIAALTIHGRTCAQMYTGEADWTLIGEVKNNPRMHIPIIGNGDVTTPKGPKSAFDRYGWTLL